MNIQEKSIGKGLASTVPMWIEWIKNWYPQGCPMTKKGIEILSKELLSGGKTVGEVPVEYFSELSKAIAILSFCPGGITIFGQHWESSISSKSKERVRLVVEKSKPRLTL
jgi:hypothetical protein